MKNKQKGRQSFIFDEAPVICDWTSVAGKKEADGPLGHKIDVVVNDPYFGEKTWEQAESKLQLLALENLKIKTGILNEEIGIIFSGDLLNQCVGSSFTLRNLKIPHIGLYGACSTMAESLLMAAIAVGGGYTQNAVALTSSHFASSERQYRFPLGYGGQRTPTAQWTVTGAVLLKNHGAGPRIVAGTIGTVTELGVTDANNMGAAMAPAALETICAHFTDMQLSVDDYDLIITGDLGQIGKELLMSLARDRGLYIGGKLEDCGTLIFDLSKQDVHSGGSGCGCSAVVLCSHYLQQLKTGKLKRILFCGTGALLSPTSVQQGLPICGVCHAVSIYGG